MNPHIDRLNVTLVAARAANGVIGNGDDLPWPKNKTDFAHFREITLDKTIIYGRKTLASLGGKALPKRRNIMLSRDATLSLPDIEVAHDPFEALYFAAKAGAEDVCVIGGQEIFELFMPCATRIELTIFEKEAVGDKVFPEYIQQFWAPLFKEDKSFVDESGWNGFFIPLTRIHGLPAAVVVPRNGMRDPDYWAELIAINTLGVCPFCPGGKTLLKQEMLDENRGWYVTMNARLAPNAKYHFVFIPKRHITGVGDLQAGELAQLQGLIQDLKNRYGFKGGVLTLREDDPVLTGASVIHLHFQYIVPEDGKVVTQVYGQWPIATS